MRPYFEKMAEIGKPLPESKIRDGADNLAKIREVEQELEKEVSKKRLAGLPEKKINEPRTAYRFPEVGASRRSWHVATSSYHF